MCRDRAPNGEARRSLAYRTEGACNTAKPAQKPPEDRSVRPLQRLEALKYFLCQRNKFADYSQERFLEVISKEWKVTEQGGHNSPNWIIKRRKLTSVLSWRSTCGCALKIKRAFYFKFQLKEVGVGWRRSCGHRRDAAFAYWTVNKTPGSLTRNYPLFSPLF